jgi:hypothetical protein
MICVSSLTGLECKLRSNIQAEAVSRLGLIQTLAVHQSVPIFGEKDGSATR